jgi:hypothetical protein
VKKKSQRDLKSFSRKRIMKNNRNQKKRKTRMKRSRMMMTKFLSQKRRRRKKKKKRLTTEINFSSSFSTQRIAPSQKDGWQSS